MELQPLQVILQNRYELLREIINGNVKWYAKDTYTGEIFAITYQQALGHELIRPLPIDTVVHRFEEFLLGRKDG